MKSTVKRLAALAAVGAMGVLVPAASASAATTPAASLAKYSYAWPSYSLPTLPAYNPGALSFVGPSVGGLSVAIGPTVITVGAGNIFTNTTITTTGGSAVVASP